MIWLTFNYWTTWRSTTRWTRTFEGLRGARMFHLVSLSLQISLTVVPGSCLGLCVCVCCFCCLFCWVGCWFLSLGKFVFNHRLTPVVDRPSLALVRQCRGKKNFGAKRDAYEQGSSIICVASYEQAQDFLTGKSLHLLGAFAKGKCNCKSKTHVLTNYKMRPHGFTCLKSRVLVYNPW